MAIWSALPAFCLAFSAARQMIKRGLDIILSMTAALTSNIVPQAAQLGDALWRWASRVALFGVGELGVALESLSAVANARSALPKDVDARIRWIASSSPARDLVGYGISEAYTEARRRAGLVAPAR